MYAIHAHAVFHHAFRTMISTLRISLLLAFRHSVWRPGLSLLNVSRFVPMGNVIHGSESNEYANVSRSGRFSSLVVSSMVKVLSLWANSKCEAHHVAVSVIALLPDIMPALTGRS